MNKFNAILKTGKFQVAFMLFLTILTQFLSICKSSMVVANFGAGNELDAFNFSNNIISFFFAFISTGITTVIIPAYVKKKDEKAINSFLTAVYGVTFLLILFTYIFRVPLVSILVNRNEDFKEIVFYCLLFSILIQGLPSFLGITAAYYQCINKYNTPKVILMISNFLVVVVLFSLKNYTLATYLNVLLLGAVLQFILDIYIAIKSGFSFSITFDFKNKEYKELIFIFLPTLFSTGAFKIQSLIDSLLAANLPEGQLTILSYSNTIVSMINNLMIGNLTIYIYPKIVRKLEKSEEMGKATLWNYAVDFHAALCLVIVGFFACGREFISILYENGKFTEEAASVLFVGACIYVFGQQNNIVRDLFYRFFYAKGDTRTTLKNSVIVSVLNIVISLALVQYLGVYGIILGTVIAGFISLVMIIIRFNRKFGKTNNTILYFFQFAKNEMALITSIIFVYIIRNMVIIENDIIKFLLFGFLSVLVYVFCLVILKSKTIRSFFR